MEASRAGILHHFGGTPLVPLRKVSPKPEVQIWAKVESRNPGGSVKDRIALAMIEHAERTGELTRDKTIIEATSGNTGIGLALVAAVKGYAIVLAMSEAVSVERRRILSALGAEFLLTPAKLGTDGAIEAVYERVRGEPDRYFMPDQFNNPENWGAHYRTTGPEVWQQTGGALTHFVAAMGTTGTVMGVSRYLREVAPTVRIVGVEPYLGHKIQGLKNLKEAYCPGIFQRSALDEKVNIHDEDAFEMARRLAREEGLFVGMSAGAAAHVAVELARQLDHGLIVTILPDGGERYLSTPLFQVPAAEAVDQEPEPGLKLLNTLSRRLEPFVPIDPDEVRIYSCGPTVQDHTHLGMCRRAVVADLLVRYLTFLGHKVRHVMNITDIDDRTIARAEQEGLSLAALTSKYTEEFFRDLDQLGVRRASSYPRATEHVEEMIAFTRKLVERGFAYEKLRSVYFSISRARGYGELSGVDLEKIKLGATVDLDTYAKDNARDFTLMKRSTMSELKAGICYKTEWGSVRPGWHVECAAMSTKLLGDEFDIHTSGSDLLFPHQENQLAQCRALTGKTPARIWLHSEMVLLDGKKMSRSSSAISTLRDALARGYTGREVRYWLLATHYRQPIRFSWDALEAARAALRRIDSLVSALRHCYQASGADLAPQVADLEAGFRATMDDDLNVSAALAEVFRFARRVREPLGRGRVSASGAGRALEALERLDRVLGFLPPDETPLDAESQALVAERNQARERGDFERADGLRAQLLERGVIIEDTREGTRWRRGR
jgi:cysteinyl-tRNA synthetase